MTYLDFILKLKVGDKVFVDSSYGNRYVGIVQEILSKYIVIDGKKFKKSNGHMVSTDTWHFTTLYKYSEEEFIELENTKRKGFLVNAFCKKISYEKLPLEKLERMWEIYKNDPS